MIPGFAKDAASAVWLAAKMVPVGVCARDSENAVWRNRLGGRVVLLGDVLANLGEWAQRFLYRVPQGTEFVRDGRGRIVGTIERPWKREGDGHGSE